MSNPSSWSTPQLSSTPGPLSGTMSGGNPVFIATEQGLGKGGVYKIYVTRSGLYGGKLANQDPKASRGVMVHLGLIGWIIGGIMAKKAEQQMAEKEAVYDSVSPEDSRFMGIDPGNFRIEPSSISSIEVKSKLGLAGWGSDYDCSFLLHSTDGKKRTFFVKKGLGGEALQNALRALTMNVSMK
jgi:hypothetical protein